MVQDDRAESASQRKGRSAFLQVACLAFLLWTACVLGLFLPSAAFAQNPSVTDGWSIQSSSGEGAVSTQHQVQWQDGKAYVFLPASADLSQTQLTNNSQDAFLINGRKLVPGKTLAFSSFALGSGITVWTVPVADASGKALFDLQVRRSQNVSSMLLTSSDPVNQGRAFVEAVKGNEAQGSMVMLNADGSVVYNNELKQIKGRGNSTWELEKKPYQIKLAKKADLLQTGLEEEKNKTWVLLANGYDPTLMNNYLVYSAAQASSLKGSVGCDFVDLWYDGEYRGSYLLSEKVQVGTGRINIPNMDDANEAANPDVEDLEALPTSTATNKYGMEYSYTPGIQTPVVSEGGYLFEFDGYYFAEKAWFSASINGQVCYFTSKNPEVWSQEQAEYLSCLVQEAFNAVASGQDLANVLDVDSVAQAYWIYEIAKNSDAFLNSSTYFYVPGEGDAKIYAGPAWDFDRALGNHAKARLCSHPSGLLVGVAPFAQQLAAHPQVKDALDRAYSPIAASFKNMWDQGNPQGMAQTRKRIATSASMNNILWWSQRWYGRWDSYDQALDYLQSWIPQRLAWIDRTGYGSTCDSVEQATVTIGTAMYTGKRLSPTVKVVLKGKTLKKDVDYQIYYNPMTDVGPAFLTIAGINDYVGLIKPEYSIVPSTKKLVSLRASSTGFTASWKASSSKQADGYQIRYATSSSMKNAVKVTVGNAASKKITGLKKDKRYYVQVRAYKKVTPAEGQQKITYVGSWSPRRSVEVTTAFGFAKVSAASGLSSGVKVRWSASRSSLTSGFEVRYATSKSMAGAVTKTVSSKKSRSCTVKGLKGNKAYYVQVRMLKKSGITTYATKWSNKVRVVTKA